MIIRNLRRRIKKYAFQSLLLCLVIYFMYHLVQGSRGILALSALEASLAKSTDRLDDLQKKHDRLAHKVSLMKPGAVCPDLLEEEAKKVLGYARQDERIVIDER